MIKISFKGNTKYIPTKISEITLGQHQEFVLGKYNDDEERELVMLHILTGIEIDDILDSPIDTYSTLKKALSFYGEENKNDKLNFVLKIDEKQYGLAKNISKMLTREYFDLDYFIKDGVDKNLHYIMAILYRPIVKYKSDTEYTIEEYTTSSLESRAKLFQSKMFCDSVITAMVFCIALGSASLEVLNGSLLIPKEKRAKKIKINNLGLKFFSRLREVLRKTKKTG